MDRASNPVSKPVGGMVKEYGSVPTLTPLLHYSYTPLLILPPYLPDVVCDVGGRAAE